MAKDRVFAKPITKRFEFDEEVASVFDDMIARSVPFYKENMELVCTLLAKGVKPGAVVYDLGCSTGSLLIDLAKKRPDLKLVGLDNSEAMIERARKKAKAFGVVVEFEVADILAYSFQEAGAMVSNYTLQFVRPRAREKLVRKIAEAIEPGGLFVCSEKIVSEDKWLDKALVEIYYDFKRSQGYSEYEIAQKKEALENVLVPYTLHENIQMLKDAGFRFVEPVFRWANFASFLAKKDIG